jgi:hypothetical protein
MIQVETNYIRADRTVEKYINNGKYIFVYNDQGLYFDVFFSEEKMKAFFENKIERGDLFFDNEEQLDDYFQ